MISVKVNLFVLRQEGLSLNLPDGSILRDVVEHFGLHQRKDIVLAVNGQRCPLDDRLEDGDSIDIFPLLEGG